MYTVTIKTEITNGEVISRFFETKKAAQKWFKWLCSQKMTQRSSLYHGEAGAELLDRYDRRITLR
jgi:hypothetical protein